MNQPYARVNQPYAMLTLASALREMFGVQLYKNNARALLSRILSILNLDWLQHARSLRGVYEYLSMYHVYTIAEWLLPKIFVFPASMLMLYMAISYRFSLFPHEKLA